MKTETKKTETKKTEIGTTEIARYLKITPYNLRKILRTKSFFPDNKNVRYTFKSKTDKIVKKLKSYIENRKTESKSKKSKSVKKSKIGNK